MSDLVTFESFELEKSYEYILSIQVRQNGFSFSVLSQQEDKILAYKLIQLKISSKSLIPRRFEEWIESEDLLKKPFKKIRVIVFSEKFTLIPENYFQDELRHNILPLLFDENSELEIAENIINKLKIRLLFAMQTGLNSVITRQIGECEIVHPIKIVLNNLPKTEKENGLLLLFDIENFYLILFNKNKILLANNYETKHANDVVYYVLSVLKQMRISTPETNLFIVNTKNKPPRIEEYLQPYFSNPTDLKLTQFLSKTVDGF